MRTFGELLTEYMQRTGISDSELARTLGVRRQTIFRWKEGLTSRPRVREDVLHCAERLRLSPNERDELLMAAGFAPENPSFKPETSLSHTPTTIEPPALLPAPPPLQTPDSTALAAASPVTVDVTSPIVINIPPRTRARERSISRRMWLILAVVLVAAAAGALFIIYRQTNAGGVSPIQGMVLPTAVPGETLIVMGKLGGPAPNYDVEGRIKNALEREIQDARLSNTHVVLLTSGIPDAATAELVRTHTGASLVLWGVQATGQVTMHLNDAGMASEESPLGALVSVPGNMVATINTASPDEVRALALLTLAQLYLNQQNPAEARAVLIQALAHPPAQSDGTAALNFYMAFAYQMSGDQDSAVKAYTQALDLAPGLAAGYVNRGISFVRQKNTPAWQADFARMLTFEPDSLSAESGLCWAYALDNHPTDALPHCDKAVKLDPTARSRDARGVVYAESGKVAEAEADFQAFLDWLKTQPDNVRTHYTSSRTAWIQALKAGTNPIDQSALDEIRGE